MAVYSRRIKLVLAMLAVTVFVLLGRVAFLQLHNNQQLASLASQKQGKLLSGEDTPRGNILDRKGESLTDSNVEPALIVFPSMLRNPEKAAQALARVLEVSPKAVSAMLANKSYTYFSGITAEQEQSAAALELYGVYPAAVKARYGADSLARHVVGHINSIDPSAWALLQGKKQETGNAYDINDAIGVKGIEAEYEDYLHASDPEFFLSSVMDARGNVIPGLSFKEVVAKAGGQKRNSVCLTLDRGLQEKVEEVMDRSSIEKGAVVVAEVATGDILASASRPNYNQNLIADSVIASDNAFNNSAFEFYNPGSVFKILITAAALEEGLVTLNEGFFCNGSYTLNTGLTIDCWDTEGHGLESFVDGFANSCNPVFIQVALRLGREKILEYGKLFGLAEAQLIGYPAPSFKSLDIESSGDPSIANAALGQKGIRLSPLQVAGMVSVIASGGYYQPPRLVSEVKSYSGETLKAFPQGQRTRVISSKVASQVQELLTEAVKQGTGKNAWIEGFGAAGKTGSAETGRIGEDGKSVVNVWFAGYAPLKNPRFAIVVLKEEGGSGGGDAAPVFKEIAEYALNNL